MPKQTTACIRIQHHIPLGLQRCKQSMASRCPALALGNILDSGSTVALTEVSSHCAHVMLQVAKVFFASDILCLVIQAAGAGISSSKTPTMQSANLAKAILMVGLVLQLVFFTAFTCITIYVNIKPKYGLRGVKQYKPMFQCIYITIFLLYVRGVFRVIEFSGGWYGPIATNETYFYIFDFSMIALCFVLFTVLHFGLHMKKVEGGLPVNMPHGQQNSHESVNKESGAITTVQAFAGAQ